METIIFGGFLGSGKTTLIQSIARAMVDEGNKVAIVENEIGEVGIDQKLVGGKGVSVTPLFGGCVCCQISGDLMEAIHDIHSEIQPDYLIVEMTGLARTTDMKQVFLRYGDRDVPLRAVAVVDCVRFLKLCEISPELMESQLAGADAVLMNKVDRTEVTPALREKVASLTRAPMLLVSGKDDGGERIWRRLKSKWGQAV